MTIKEYLETSGIRHKNWAEKCRISNGYLSMLINGHSKPSPSLALLMHILSDGKIDKDNPL